MDNTAITKSMLNIPDSLDAWYLSRGWFDFYWMEIPLDWQDWSDDRLSRYPVTREIVNWRKHNATEK